ncbi:hypothetical protein OBA41_02350 [Pelagibacteraceae bacterium]|nr:hypothetical protein [Pelagibacteraceae bacterium]
MNKELEDLVILEVTHELGVTKELLLSNRRDIMCVIARQFLVYMLNYYFGYDTIKIADAIGKDRSTIHFNIYAFEKSMRKNNNYLNEFIRVDKGVSRIVRNYMDYLGYDRRPFRSTHNILAGTDFSRVDRILNRHRSNQEREHQLQDVESSNS